MQRLLVQRNHKEDNRDNRPELLPLVLVLQNPLRKKEGAWAVGPEEAYEKGVAGVGVAASGTSACIVFHYMATVALKDGYSTDSSLKQIVLTDGGSLHNLIVLERIEVILNIDRSTFLERSSSKERVGGRRCLGQEINNSLSAPRLSRYLQAL